MLRYMLCPIIGTGTGPDPFRVAVEDLGSVNSAALIPTNNSGPNIGKPKYRFALCQVATPSIPAISAVSNAFVFPDYPLDGRMDGMDADARNALVQSVHAYDIDGAGLHLVATHADSESYRDVLNAIGQQMEPVFNVNQFTVREVS